MRNLFGKMGSLLLGEKFAYFHQMLVFDKAEGVSCDINETTSDGDYVFLHISSDKYTTKTPE